MSSDYYFKKWKQILVLLEHLLHLDIEYQKTKVHDKKLFQATERLSGVLGEYIAIYNDALDCLQQNLQVQKTQYIADVVKTIVARILELKHQLSKLDNSNYQFLAKGLINHKLTTYDAEFIDIPEKMQRAEHLTTVIKEVMKKAEVEREKSDGDYGEILENLIEFYIAQAKNAPCEELEEEGGKIWRDGEVKIEEVREKVSQEVLRRQEMVNLISAHEKSRQVIKLLKHQKLEREMWVMELEGTLKPQARGEIRQRAAKLIQEAFRCYFELKRKRITDCKRDELLDIRRCKKPSQEAKKKAAETSLFRAKKYEAIGNKWKDVYDKMKQEYFNSKAEDIADDFRDIIRNWFQQWFNEVQFFYDIPTEKQGGSTLILRHQVPAPSEWLEQYKAYIAKKADKSNTPEQLKQEKQEAKREVMMQKKEQKLKEKQADNMLKKLMKNPTKHPGYYYPESKKTEDVLKAIEKYHAEWNDLDVDDTLDVKQGSVKAKDKQQICMEVKLEVMKTVDEQIRQELKELKISLKLDYERNQEEMPKIMKQPGDKQGKRKKKLKAASSKNFADKLLKLAVQGLLKEYPRTKFEDFMGDPNFAGDDLRSICQPALPFYGETRNVWWERCRGLTHGFHKMLLVGASGSGKNTLIHAMASVNNALLFELDPSQLRDEASSSSAFLQQLVNNLTSCARATQPCIIHIRNIHRLFYTKVPLEDAALDLNQLKRYLTKELCKGIQKNDNIAIIGTCVDPWLTKSKQMLKQFPTVILMPNTSYSVTVQILKDWVISNRAIPYDLDVNSLAYVLQGYNFAYLKQALQNFMSADQIIKIAAKGLNPMEVHNFILLDENETKTGYEKYLKWYRDNTNWGQKEKKHEAQQLEFKLILEKYAEIGKKKLPASYINSMQSVVSSIL